MAKNTDFIVEIRAEELGYSIDQLEGLADEVQAAVQDIANGAYAKVVSMAQAQLDRTRLDYLNGLKFQKLGEDSYLINLEGEWPNKIEDGYPDYSLREMLLRSAKIVEVGPRAGLPWVQKNKQGKKFAHVPFEHKPFSKAPQASDLAGALKQLQAKNAQGEFQSITKAFKDSTGRPIDSGSGADARAVARVTDVSSLDQVMGNRLAGLVKYQKVHTNASGKETVQSLYHTYRTVSESGKDWRHPGYEGLKAFDEAEKFIAFELDNILKKILG